MHTGAKITEVLKNTEEVIDGFTTKLKVENDEEDLEDLMATARHEKLTSSQVPEIMQEKMTMDTEGNVEKEQVYCKFIFSHLYYYLFYRVIANEERF